MQEQITNEPEPGCCVTVMRPGTALCSPCTFYTTSPPFSSLFFLFFFILLPSLSCPLSLPSPLFSISLPQYLLTVKLYLLLSSCSPHHVLLFLSPGGGHPVPFFFLSPAFPRHCRSSIPANPFSFFNTSHLTPRYLLLSCPPFTSTQVFQSAPRPFLFPLLSLPFLSSLGDPHYELSQVD